MVDAETTPKRAAVDNPWYRLATRHGEPKHADDERADKNRETWNRWMAPRLPEELKAALRKKGWSDTELTLFSAGEQQSIAAQVGLPLEADWIDFSCLTSLQTQSRGGSNSPSAPATAPPA